MPALDTPYVRRVKAGSNEDFTDDCDHENYPPGKKFNTSSVGSIVSLHKDALGIKVLDVQYLGPPSDTLPSIDTPANRRVAAGSTEDFDEGDDINDDDSNDDDEVAGLDATGNRRKLRGDSVNVLMKSEFIIPRLDIHALGGPPGKYYTHTTACAII